MGRHTVLPSRTCVPAASINQYNPSTSDIQTTVSRFQSSTTTQISYIGKHATNRKISTSQKPTTGQYTPNTLNIHNHRNASTLTYRLTMTTLNYYVTSKHYISTFPVAPTYTYIQKKI
jgi:hypothetical protein